MRFVLIDKITAFRPGHGGTAVKHVSLSEDFFEDHFPLKPIMPGVLILEGMAQLAGLLLEESARAEQQQDVKALLSIVEKAKFRAPATPGDSLQYQVDIESLNEVGGRVKARANVGERRIADAAMVFSFHALHNEILKERQAVLVSHLMKGLDE